MDNQEKIAELKAIKALAEHNHSLRMRKIDVQIKRLESKEGFKVEDGGITQADNVELQGELHLEVA